MRSPKAWESHWSYRILRPYTNWVIRTSLLRIKRRGELPENGAVILCPNHTNCLIDPLVLLPLIHKRIVFGARQDVFRKPALNWFIRMAGVLPISRIRDGIREVSNNHDTFDDMLESLSRGLPVCMYGEGTHRQMHSLQPIRKGLARMALESAQTMKTWLVPVGVEYGDWTHFVTTCQVSFGTPIDVNALMEANPELLSADRCKLLQDKIFEGIKEQILYLPDDENYPAAWQRIKAERPRTPRVLKLLAALLTFPLFLLATLLSLPLPQIAEYVCKKLKDKAFRNSVRFLVRWIGTPVLAIIWAIVFFCALPWWAALLLTLAVLFAFPAFYFWLGLLDGDCD